MSVDWGGAQIPIGRMSDTTGANISEIDATHHHHPGGGSSLSKHIRPAAVSFILGMVLTVSNLSWLVYASGVLAPMLWIVVAAYYPAWAVLVRVTEPKISSYTLRMFIAAVLWCGLEYFRAEVIPLRFGWGALGYYQVNRFGFWLSSKIGVYGVGFVIVLWARLSVAVIGKQRRDVIHVRATERSATAVSFMWVLLLIPVVMVLIPTPHSYFSVPMVSLTGNSQEAGRFHPHFRHTHSDSKSADNNITDTIVGNCRLQQIQGENVGAVFDDLLKAVPTGEAELEDPRGTTRLSLGDAESPNTPTRFKRRDVTTTGEELASGSKENEATTHLYANNKVDLLVWPEYSYFFNFLRLPSSKKKAALIASTFTNVAMVIGSIVRIPGGTPHDFWNTAIVMDPEGEVFSEAVKNQPIQIFSDGRPAPTVSVTALGPFKHRCRSSNCDVSNVPLAGTELTTAQDPAEENGHPAVYLKTGIGVCYDATFTQFARRMSSDRNADLLIFPSMNAQEWTHKQHSQFAVMFRFRAAENERQVLVAARYGPTMSVDAKGRVIGGLPYDVTKSVDVPILTRNSQINVYSELWGWTFAPICCFFTAIAIGGPVIRKLMN